MVETAPRVKAVVENAGNLAEIAPIAMMNIEWGHVEDGCNRRR